MRSILFWGLMSLLMSNVVFAQSAREIMEQMDLNQRKVADSTLTKSSLSTCPFGQQGKQIVCVDSPRLKSIESVSRQLGEELKDSQGISIILEPASERGIGMLTYSYDDEYKDTESWLYLSALGRVKRLASGTGEDREPVSIFGSEFTTEDMESGKTDEYEYKILQEGPYGGREVWVIEALPKASRLKKTEYSKLYVWVDKERYVPLKVQSYDKREQLYKRMVFQNFDKINGLWFARETTIMNLKSQRLSKMDTQAIAMGVEVDPEFLTQRTLTDFAYREKELAKLRAFFR